MITLTIDGKQVNVNEGATVYEAAREAGIYIPTLCYHPYLSPYGACRLCIVEIEKMQSFPTSCTIPAGDGMVVRTNTPQLDELRRGFLELILAKHPNTCLTCEHKHDCEPFRATIRKVGVTTGCQYCPNNGRCELQDVVDYIGIKEIRVPYKYRDIPIERRDPFFERDYNLCILCGRCVRVCQEVRGQGAIAFTQRSNQTLVGTAFGQSLQEAGCRFCAACVDICPTGALRERRKKWEGLAERSVVTTCPYCGVGCQLELEVKGERVIGVIPSDGVNRGQSCVRGRFGIVEIVHHPQRLKTPLVRRDGQMVETTWDEALEVVANQFRHYNGEEVAVICCAESTNEETYVLQKLARVVLGTNNIDHYARLCHVPTIASLSRIFGNGVMTNSIAEIADTRCILAIGIDVGSSQPVVGVEVKRALNNGAKLIVANPYWVELCRSADLWLQYAPGSDMVLLGGIMKVIIDEGLADISFIKKHCDEFDSLKESLDGLKLDYVEEVTGVHRSQIMAAVRMYAASKPAYILYGEGLTQQYHGCDSVLATANLALLTGNVGKPSAGVNTVVGLNNVQGACDMGAMPDYYPGYQPVTDVASRQRFEAAWGSSLNPDPGLTLTEILQAIGQGQIKAAYVIGDDPILNGKLKDLDFLVFQGMFPSQASQTADVILPAASFVEKEGTFTNAERRIQLVRKVIEPIASSQPDWWIICQIAHRLGGKGFDFNKPAGIMAEIRATVPIYGGISYRRLEKGGLQWPYTSSRHAGTRFLHRGTFNGGRARFTPLEYRSPVEADDTDYPMILTTEPSLYYFHASAMDVSLGEFSILDGSPQVAVNPGDAVRLEIGNGEVVRVVSRWGKTPATVKVTNGVPTGVVSIPLHHALSIINPITDPVSKIPEYKVCAVRLERNHKNSD